MSSHLIFYIDDNSDDLSMFLYVAKSLAINVRLFSSGEHLLIHASQCNEIPDAILVDLHMPKISGFDIIGSLHHNTMLKSAPIIAFSTNAESSAIHKAKAAGATCYMKKPRTVTGLRQNLSLLISTDWKKHDCNRNFLIGK